METYEIWERDDAATLNGLTGNVSANGRDLFSECRFRRKQQTTIHAKQVMKLLQVIPNPLGRCSTATGTTAIYPATTNTLPGNLSARPKRSTSRKKPSSSTSKQARRAYRSCPIRPIQGGILFSFEPVDVPADGEIGAYYKRGIRPARSSRRIRKQLSCGIPFVPVKALAKHRGMAAQEYQRQFGEMPSWASEEQPAPIVAPQ